MTRKNQVGKEPKTTTRTVEVIESGYQPSKAEMEADISINKTPEEVGRALMQTVDVRRVAPKARERRGK